jgi:hypothetical protein
MNNVPERIIERQIKYFGSLQDAREFIRRLLHQDGVDVKWAQLDATIMSKECPYGIYFCDEYDDVGALIENNGYIVYLKTKTKD